MHGASELKACKIFAEKLEKVRGVNLWSVFVAFAALSQKTTMPSQQPTHNWLNNTIVNTQIV